jgi:hypothetical protein
MDRVMDYLQCIEGEARDVLDVQKLQETIKDFKEMRAQIGGPIVEKKVIIPKQEQNEESKATSNFKVKVLSQRKPIEQQN